jgi:hypothetical protein
MRTYIFEVIPDDAMREAGVKLGAVLVGVLDKEWIRDSVVDKSTNAPVVQRMGWSGGDVLVTDLATGEGARFHPSLGDNPRAALAASNIRVTPTFAPFLDWLYTWDVEKIHCAPARIYVTDPPAMLPWHHRRDGAKL